MSVAETVSSAHWILSGYISIYEQHNLTRATSHRLKFVRRSNHLSPQIWFAMKANFRVRVLEIHTPHSKVKLLNVKIVSITHPAPHQTPRPGVPAITSELEEFELLFNRIMVTFNTASAADDWTTQGS